MTAETGLSGIKTQQNLAPVYTIKLPRKLQSRQRSRMPSVQPPFISYVFLIPGNASGVTFSLQFRSRYSSSDLFLPFPPAAVISVCHLNSLRCLDVLHSLCNCLVVLRLIAQPYSELFWGSGSPPSGRLDDFRHFGGSHVPDRALPMAALNPFVFLPFSAALRLPEPLMFISLFPSCVLSQCPLLFFLFPHLPAVK